MANRKPTSKGLVVQTLVVKPNTRSALDVGQWRQALKAADRGKREKLYDLYEDVMLDLILSDAIDKRIDAITNAELTFTRNEQPVPEIDTLMDTPEFEEILREIMLAKFWGKTVLEFDFTDGLKPYSIPRKHIRPDKGEIVVNPSDETGITYRGDDFFLEVGKDNDLGLLLKLAPMAIYKRGGFGDWAQFVEIFGMPQRIGKYSSHDDESRKVLEQALENAGSAPWLVVPKETDIETKESTSFSNALMHEKFKNSCNEEMLIGVLGQTMTTLNGSSRSQGEVHKEVEEGKNKSDRRFVQRVLNHLLLPMLEKRGYPVAGGYFMFTEAGENLSTSEQADIHDKLINRLGLEIDQDWLYEYYGVPAPKGGAKQKPKKEEKPKDNKSDGEEQKLFERVLNFFLGAPAEMGATSETCPDCGGNHPTNFNLANLPAFSNDALINRIANGGATLFDAELFRYTTKALRAALAKGFTPKKQLSPGIAYGWEPDALKTAMDINIFRFSAGKTLAEVKELNSLFKQAENFKQFEDAAKQLTDTYNTAWLRTEYDTAYLTAESSAAYWRLQDQTDIFPYWQYITVQDGRVREEHAALHGLTLPANDPRWAKIYPPNGWNCRCRIVPLTANEVQEADIDTARKKVDTYFKSKEFKRNAKQGFDVNKALTGEVFAKNQQYVNQILGKRATAKLGAKDWVVNTLTDAIGKATKALPEYSGNAADFFTKAAKDGLVNFNDYLGRAITLNRVNFNKSARKAGGSNYLNALKDIIASPDEVWFSDFSTLVFVKFYKGKAIAVRGGITNKNAYQVLEWFGISERLNPRSGLLIR